MGVFVEPSRIAVNSPSFREDKVSTGTLVLLGLLLRQKGEGGKVRLANKEL